MVTFCCPNCQEQALNELEAKDCYVCTKCWSSWEIAPHGPTPQKDLSDEWNLFDRACVLEQLTKEFMVFMRKWKGVQR